MKKIIRITTVPASLGGLLKGQLHFMSNYFEVIGIASAQGNKLEEVGTQEGIRVIPVEMTRKITPFQDLKSVYQLYKIFKKEKPFIVHTHTPKAGIIGMIAAILAGVPHRLHTIAGLPLVVATGTKRKILNTVEKITYACATKIYPNSFGLKTIILENKFATLNKLKVIGNGSSNGIDTSYFNSDLYDVTFKESLRSKLKIEPTDFVFIFAGRLVKDKGINELIEAFEKISSKYSQVKLMLLGVYEKHLDPLSSKTEECINTNKNIIYLGWQNDVRPYYAIANALVFPSYREGFPNVVLQSAAMGLPGIVTNINGCNEIIQHNKNGMIIPVQDTEAIFNSMEYFLTNPENVKSMAENARKDICKNYEQKNVWEALLQEYNTLN